MLTVDVSNLEKLEQLTALAFPYTLTVARHQEVTLSVSFKGQRASAAENDIVATATFGSLSETAAATAVKLEVVPQVQFPAGFPNRHVFGVCENVTLYSMPSSLLPVSWIPSGQVFDVAIRRNEHVFQYGIDPGSVSFNFSYKGYSRTVDTTCLAPQNMVCPQLPTPINSGMAVGHAGGVGMNLSLVLCPTNVSLGTVGVEKFSRRVQRDIQGHIVCQ